MSQPKLVFLHSIGTKVVFDKQVCGLIGRLPVFLVSCAHLLPTDLVNSLPTLS